MDENDQTLPEITGGVVQSDDVSKLAGLLGGADDAKGTKQASHGADPAPDDDTPAPERAAGGDDEAERETDDDESPAVEAPASWDAAAKEKFKALPPDVQKIVSDIEAERAKGVSEQVQQAAKEREALAAKQNEIGQLRSAYEQRLIAQARHLESTIPAEFKDIKSAADLYAIAQKDPALAARFTAFQQQAASVMNELAQIEAQRQNEHAAQHREHLAKEHEAISKVWPEFVDQSKGPAIRAELSAYAKERGFSDTEVSGLADHRLVMVLRDAIEGRKAKAALEKAKAKADKPNLPKVAKPGQGQGSQRNGLDRASLNAALRSGSTDRQVAAMARILEGS
jgi:hypothetical protein